jgi:hypothetical protein
VLSLSFQSLILSLIYFVGQRLHRKRLVSFLLFSNATLRSIHRRSKFARFAYNIRIMSVSYVIPRSRDNIFSLARVLFICLRVPVTPPQYGDHILPALNLRKHRSFKLVANTSSLRDEHIFNSFNVDLSLKTFLFFSVFTWHRNFSWFKLTNG